MKDETLGKYTILVVDDEDVLREAIAFDFRRMGFNVLEANSGNTAFEIVLKNQVHLIVSDMRMPGGDGMSLLEKVKKYNPKIPVVVFITGYADVTEQEAISCGAKKVLSKPFDRKELKKVVFENLGIPLAEV